MRVVSQAVFIRCKYLSDDVEVTARYSLCGQCCRLDAPSEVTRRMFRHKTRIHSETNTNILLQVTGILKWDRKTSLSLSPKSRVENGVILEWPPVSLNWIYFPLKSREMALKQSGHKKAEPVQQREKNQKKNQILLEHSNLPGEDSEQKGQRTFSLPARVNVSQSEASLTNPEASQNRLAVDHWAVTPFRAQRGNTPPLQ